MNCAPPQRYVPVPEPTDVSLFGKRVLADVKDLEMKSSWTTQVDPKPNDSVLIEDKREDTQEEEVEAI